MKKERMIELLGAELAEQVIAKVGEKQLIFGEADEFVHKGEYNTVYHSEKQLKQQLTGIFDFINK